MRWCSSAAITARAITAAPGRARPARRPLSKRRPARHRPRAPRHLPRAREERPDFTFIYGWTAWLFFLLHARRRGHTRLGFTCMLDTEVNGEFRRANPLRGALFEQGIRRADVRYAITDYEVEWLRPHGAGLHALPAAHPAPERPGGGERSPISSGSPLQRNQAAAPFSRFGGGAAGSALRYDQPGGKPRLFAAISARAARLPNLVFCERVPYHEVQAWYDRAHVFVNTSTWEGFANSFIQAGQGEAAILSLPWILTAYWNVSVRALRGRPRE